MTTEKKIIVAPDSFKGSLSAPEICSIFTSQWQQFFPGDKVLSFPLADGGEGTVNAMVKATAGELHKVLVRGPLGDEVEACWGILGDGKTAIIEMAAASGLFLINPARRDPFLTSTFGTGQLIREALNFGCKSVIIGIGGSATNDGGAGMARALGVRFLDDSGASLSAGGRFLANLNRIDLAGLHPRIKDTEFVVACDVDNPLCGPEGASAVYGPQKGASPEMVDELDRALCCYARVVKKELGIDITQIPGAGAAGGLGAGLIAFLGASLKPGVSLIMEHVGLEQAIKSGDIDLVITGEGEINAQTIRGKVPCGVASLARKHGIPVIAIVGSAAGDASVVFEHGIDAIVDIIPRSMPLEKAMENAEELLRQGVANLARLRKVFSSC